MTVSVRDPRPDVRSDVEEFALVRHLALPFVLWTPDAVLHHLTHTRPDTRARSLVAEEDGEVIGTARVGLVHESPEPGQAYLTVYVRPDRSRRGAGGLPVRAAERCPAAEGATRLLAWVLDAETAADGTGRRRHGVGRLRGVARADLAALAAGPRPDHRRGRRRPPRRLHRGPYGRRQPVCDGDDRHRPRPSRPGSGQAGQERDDTGTGPMLAVNTWFEYEVRATEVRYVRELG